jgi:hypothetical protein
MQKQRRPTSEEPPLQSCEDSKQNKKLEQAQQEAAEDRKKGGYQ